MRGVLLIVVVSGCGKPAVAPPVAPEKPADPVPAAAAPTRVHQASVQEGFIVVIPKGGDVRAIEARALARTEKVGAEVGELAMPTLDDEYRRLVKYENPALTDADLDGIAAGTPIVIKATGEPVATLRAIAPISFDAATAAHGWVVDPMVGAVAYAPAQFERHLPGDPLDVRTQIYVHGVSGEGELPYLDTAGMPKLGFPELMVAAVPASQVDEVTALVNATAQTMLAHPDLTVPGTLDVDLAALPWGVKIELVHQDGGTGRARWLTRWHAAQGDDAPMIELVPATGSGTEAVTALIDTCFGKPKDQIADAKDDDPELLAAAEKARTELVAMRSHFAKGVPFGERLLVKAPFTEHAQTEWMWVEVVTWNGDAFQGTLDSEPSYVTSVRAGSQVSVPFAKVADYFYVRSDGSKVGGYSVEILKNRGLLR